MKATPFERHLPFIDEKTLVPNEEHYIQVADDDTWGLEIPADSGYLNNDGPGTLEVRIADDGEHYTQVQTVKSGGSAEWENDDDIWIHTVHIVADATGASYRAGFARSRW